MISSHKGTTTKRKKPKHDVEELAQRARRLFNEKDAELQEKLITLAREETPSGAYQESLGIINNQHLAKAVRFLAIIKRDYGAEAQEEVISLYTCSGD